MTTVGCREKIYTLQEHKIIILSASRRKLVCTSALAEHIAMIRLCKWAAFISIPRGLLFFYTRWLERQEGARVEKTLRKKIKTSKTMRRFCLFFLPVLTFLKRVLSGFVGTKRSHCGLSSRQICILQHSSSRKWTKMGFFFSIFYQTWTNLRDWAAVWTAFRATERRGAEHGGLEVCFGFITASLNSFMSCKEGI